MEFIPDGSINETLMTIFHSEVWAGCRDVEEKEDSNSQMLLASTGLKRPRRNGVTIRKSWRHQEGANDRSGILKRWSCLWVQRGYPDPSLLNIWPSSQSLQLAESNLWHQENPEEGAWRVQVPRANWPENHSRRETRGMHGQVGSTESRAV